MKKILAVLLSIITLVSFASPYMAKESKTILQDAQFIGITSSDDEQIALLSNTTPVFKNVTICINHLDIHDGINIKGTINTPEGNKKFHFTGNMYISRKQDQGIEAYVGKIKDKEKNFIVNYFEIKNDNSYDLLKYSENLLEKRVLSFDLECDGAKYYFELDLDALGVTFDSRKITRLAPENIDFYKKYVNEELSTEPCIIPYDPEIIPIAQPLSTYSYLTIGDMWYHEQVVYGWFSSSTYQYYALGGMEGNIVDVSSSGTANWTSALKFWGHVKKNGTTITNQQNYFNIKAGVNVNSSGQAVSVGDKIEFRIYTGNNTVFTSGRFNGTCKINGSETSNNLKQFDLIMGLATSISGYINPYVNGTVKAVSLASKLFQVTNTIDYTLGTDFITGSSSVNKYVVCNKFDTSISLDESDHELFFTGFVSTISSNKTANLSTDCVIEWDYNMCNGNRVLKREKVSETITYVANMQ